MVKKALLEGYGIKRQDNFNSSSADVVCFFIHHPFPLQACDEIIVVHLGYLNYTCYQIAVSFKGLENVTYDFKVDFVVSGLGNVLLEID